MSNVPIYQFVSNILQVFKAYLPFSATTVPTASISLVNFKERTVGIGNRISAVKFGGFNLFEIKGIRLEALVRFQQWADTYEAINSENEKLCKTLLADRVKLKELGVLQLDLERSSDVEFIASLNAWRIISDYKVLFEFQYTDNDHAASLITHIPVESKLENYQDSLEVFNVLSDGMVRWDNETAMPLVIKGPVKLKTLSGISFIPGDIPSGYVSITRSFLGATENPKIFPSLSSFLDSVAGQNSNESNAKVNFDSVAVFLSTLTSTYEPLILGDWNLDNEADQYETASFTFNDAIYLKSHTDFVTIAYDGIKFDQPSVVYLRVGKE